MVLRIRTAQSKLLAQESFCDRMMAIICQHYPGEARTIHAEDMRAAIIHQTKAAKGYGLGDEQAVAKYVLAAWLLGPDFDRRLPIAAHILSTPGLSSAAKAGALEHLSVTLLGAIEDAARHNR